MDEQAKQALNDRISRLVGLANAAISSQNLLDLAAIQNDLGDVTLNSSEIAVLQGFVAGAITEQQTRQLLQAAQTQQNAESLISEAVALNAITKAQAEKLTEVSKPAPQAAEEVPAVAGVIGPQTARIAGERDESAQSAGRGAA